jgi:ABC-type polysaccharide/polyol phosphate transport system ATPase subunit
MNDFEFNIGLKLNRVKVDYPIYDSNAQVLQRRLMSIATLGRTQRHLGDIRVIHALKDISLDVLPGSSIGQQRDGK